MTENDADEFEGDAIADRLARPGAEVLVAALAGCRTYRNDPDATDEVLSCDPVRQRLLVRTLVGNVREVALRGAYLVSGDGRLRLAMEALTSDADRTAAADARRVAAWGLVGRIEAEDTRTLAAAIEAVEQDRLDARPARERAAALARRYGTARHTLRFTAQWLRLSGDPPPADVLIEHVACLREVGEVGQALAATDVLRRRDHGLTPRAQAVLFTQRAALWLDQYDLGGDIEALARARECAKRSWSIAPSEHCSAVLGRLGKLERERSDAE